MLRHVHVQMNDIRKSYSGSSFTLQIPQLRIGHGERIGLVGNNGAGKTTLLHVMMGSTRLQGGAVIIDGKPVPGCGEWRFSTSCWFGDGSLIPFLTPAEYWSFVGEAYGLSRGEVQRRVGFYDAFHQLGLHEQRRKYLRQYSLGSRKKIGLVASFIVEPDLLVLDEPSASLDPRSQALLTRVLLQVNQEIGTTIILSSHDLEHVAELSTRIIALDEGRIAFDRAGDAQMLPLLRRSLGGPPCEGEAA